MIDPRWAVLAATVCLGVGDWCNRRWFGWLPDDPPRPGRKQHARPMPLAGIALLPAFLPWCVAARAWLPLAAIAVAATTGFVDDRNKERGHDLDWRVKALGLAFAAGAVAAAVAPPLEQPLWWLGGTALVFVLTNATNFLDNTDGVAASVAGVSLLVLGTGAAGSADEWIVAAGLAALAFVPWNWPRPRLFLGDGGAYALGVATGYALLRALPGQPLALTATAVQLVDFTQVVVARLVIGVPPWVGDRRHLTHIAQNAGVPRFAVAPLFAALALLAAARLLRR